MRIEELQGLRKTCLRQGEKRFGAASGEILARIEAIPTFEELIACMLNITTPDVGSWSELLARWEEEQGQGCGELS